MSEALVTQFDVLIHPDYHLGCSLYPSVDQEDVERRLAWDRRVSLLAVNPQAVMFYFSTFMDLKHHVLSKRDRFHRFDKLRTHRYRDQLGDRFFLFAGSERPNRDVLNGMLQGRGFIYDSATANLYAYGEFYDLCVHAWQRHLTNVLDLKGSNSHKLADLSLKDNLDIDFTRKRDELERMIVNIRREDPFRKEYKSSEILGR